MLKRSILRHAELRIDELTFRPKPVTQVDDCPLLWSESSVLIRYVLFYRFTLLLDLVTPPPHIIPSY